MLTFAKRAVAAALVTAVVGVTAAPAQFSRPFPRPQQIYINQNPFIAPGLTLRQWQYNTSVLGGTLQQFPRWLVRSANGFGGYGGFGAPGQGGNNGSIYGGFVPPSN